MNSFYFGASEAGLNNNHILAKYYNNGPIDISWDLSERPVLVPAVSPSVPSCAYVPKLDDIMAQPLADLDIVEAILAAQLEQVVPVKRQVAKTNNRSAKTNNRSLRKKLRNGYNTSQTISPPVAVYIMAGANLMQRIPAVRQALTVFAKYALMHAGRYLSFCQVVNSINSWPLKLIASLGLGDAGSVLLANFTTVSVMAPIVEELIFRGATGRVEAMARQIIDSTSFLDDKQKVSVRKVTAFTVLVLQASMFAMVHVTNGVVKGANGSMAYMNNATAADTGYQILFSFWFGLLAQVLNHRYGLTDSVILHLLNNMFITIPFGAVLRAGLLKMVPPGQARVPLRNNMFLRTEEAKVAVPRFV